MNLDVKRKEKKIHRRQKYIFTFSRSIVHGMKIMIARLFDERCFSRDARIRDRARDFCTTGRYGNYDTARSCTGSAVETAQISGISYSNSTSLRPRWCLRFPSLFSSSYPRGAFVAHRSPQSLSRRCPASRAWDYCRPDLGSS